jgi:hypothetical protein
MKLNEENNEKRIRKRKRKTEGGGRGGIYEKPHHFDKRILAFGNT